MLFSFCFVCFFFFKQKTAYEMRISDWSSDVCSSDLLRRQEQGEAYFIFTRQHHTLLGGITLSNIRRGASQCGELGYWTGAPHAGQRYMTAALALMMAHCFGTMRQIGRGSCRARVCQYG